MKEDIREMLASLQHDIWAHWMRYMFACCVRIEGNLVIPEDKVLRWKRQVSTHYSKLTEEEKESDREQVDKIIKMLKEIE